MKRIKHMKITILGCGRWGTFLAWYFNEIGFDVLLWGRENSLKLQQLESTRKNDYVNLSPKITLTSSLTSALDFSDILLIAIKEQSLRELMHNICNLNFFGKTFVLCMKGIENNSEQRLTEVVDSILENQAQVAIITGPGQPTDLVKGTPTCMIIDSKDKNLSQILCKEFSSSLISFLPGNDLIGNEIGAAINKLIGIAGGILDGLGHSSLKGPLMVAGTYEISVIIKCMGGKADSAYGLCCLGDYQASLFSEYSNSVAFGKSLVDKQKFNKHAPGAFTAQVVIDIINKRNISAPLLLHISQIILQYENPESLIKIIKEYRW